MLTGVVLFIFVLIVLLAIPITLKFNVSWPVILTNDIKLQWAFGLISVQVPIFKSKPPSTKNKRQKIANSKQSVHKNKNIINLIRKDTFRRRIFRYASDFWQAVHKEDVRLRIRIGLDDPADTGQLWAILGPVSGMLSNINDAMIEIEPEFLDSTFKLDSSGNIRFYPLQIIYLTIGMLLSPSVWQGKNKYTMWNIR